MSRVVQTRSRSYLVPQFEADSSANTGARRIASCPCPSLARPFSGGIERLALRTHVGMPPCRADTYVRAAPLRVGGAHGPRSTRVLGCRAPCLQSTGMGARASTHPSEEVKRAVKRSVRVLGAPCWRPRLALKQSLWAYDVSRRAPATRTLIAPRASRCVPGTRLCARRLAAQSGALSGEVMDTLIIPGKDFLQVPARTPARSRPASRAPLAVRFAVIAPSSLSPPRSAFAYALSTLSQCLFLENRPFCGTHFGHAPATQRALGSLGGTHGVRLGGQFW